MFSKKKSGTPGEAKDKDKDKQPQDLKVRLDSLEMESVADQLREIEAKKAKEKKK